MTRIQLPKLQPPAVSDEEHDAAMESLVAAVAGERGSDGTEHDPAARTGAGLHPLTPKERTT